MGIFHFTLCRQRRDIKFDVDEKSSKSHFLLYSTHTHTHTRSIEKFKSLITRFQLLFRICNFTQYWVCNYFWYSNWFKLLSLNQIVDLLINEVYTKAYLKYAFKLDLCMELRTGNILTFVVVTSQEGYLNLKPSGQRVVDIYAGRIFFPLTLPTLQVSFYTSASGGNGIGNRLLSSAWINVIRLG